ncbi:MAG: hypothetical protein ACI8RW_000002 [Porticoccaceae bacterium]|jgi:hypothetical protein
MDMPTIDSIPWSSLEHAYGSAADASKYLHDLAHGNEDEIDEAVYGFLHSSACHQYTTYSSTPYVVRYVINLLSSDLLLIEQTSEILGFIYACTFSAKDKELLKSEIVNGSACFKKYLKHSDPKVVENAKKLLVFCGENSA